jgi:glycosyltransferase involved in cell wall biosynthesis
MKIPFGVDILTLSVPTEERRPGAVVSVGTVGLRKGHDHLIKSLRMLSARNASLTPVGAVTPWWDERLRLDQSGVRATGPVSLKRVIEELRQASVFVLLSAVEGLALVTAQAMAQSQPVNATEARGYIAASVERIAVPGPRTLKLLAKRGGSLLSDSDQAQAMSVAAHRKVESFGEWDRYGRQAVAAVREGRSGPA